MRSSVHVRCGGGGPVRASADPVPAVIAGSVDRRIERPAGGPAEPDDL